VEEAERVRLHELGAVQQLAQHAPSRMVEKAGRTIRPELARAITEGKSPLFEKNQ
jgi:hypothetical protein